LKSVDSCNQNGVCPRRVLGCLTAIFMLSICGCADFFAQRPTEVQTRRLLNELRQVKENPHVDNPLPELYRRPPEEIEVEDGIKVFYFCRNHPVEKLVEIVDTQFSKFFRRASGPGNKTGEKYPKPTYSVSPNPATNQMIIHCPSSRDAKAVLEFLEKVDVPPIQVNIDCLILERFADVTMDWETTIKIDNLFGERIVLGGKTDPDTGELLPNFPGASLRESKRSEFGLSFGYSDNLGITGHEFRALIDVLISNGYLKILMNPTIETVNGQKAKIVMRDNVPLEKILLEPGFNRPFSLTAYQWVEDKLEVTPHVFADGSISLTTNIQLGSKSKPEGVAQTSIITERTIEVTGNRIKPGNSLIIGGIRKTEERSVVRGIPFIKDIPVVGALFSSKDFEEKATEVMFILTPSISSGGMEHRGIVDEVREKYAQPETKSGLGKMFRDPFRIGDHWEAEKQRQEADGELKECLTTIARIKTPKR